MTSADIGSAADVATPDRSFPRFSAVPQRHTIAEESEILFGKCSVACLDMRSRAVMTPAIAPRGSHPRPPCVVRAALIKRATSPTDDLVWTLTGVP